MRIMITDQQIELEFRPPINKILPIGNIHPQPAAISLIIPERE